MIKRKYVLLILLMLTTINMSYAQGWLSGRYRIVAISPQPPVVSGYSENVLVFNAVTDNELCKTFFIKLDGSEISRELTAVIMAAYYKPKTTTRVQIYVSGNLLGSWQEATCVSVFDQ